MEEFEQFDFFGPADVTAVVQRVFREREIELPYWERDGNIIRVDLPGNRSVEITRQRDGRLYGNVPDYGPLPKTKNAPIILSALAKIARAIEIDDIESELREEQRNLHRALHADLIRAKSHETKPRLRHKLAREPRQEKLELRFINPKSLMGSEPNYYFGILFAWLNNVPGITPVERVAYALMAFRADDDGVFRRSLRRLASDCGISRQHLQHNIIPSMMARPLIARQDRGPGRKDWFRFVDPKQFGWLTKLATQPGQLPLPDVAKPDSHTGQRRWPHKERVKERLQKTISRPTTNRAQDEQFLIEQIRTIVGDAEMMENGGLWRMRIRHRRKAVYFAIEDWKNQSPDQQRSIRNRAAWLTDRHARALVEIDNAKEHLQ